MDPKPETLNPSAPKPDTLNPETQTTPAKEGLPASNVVSLSAAVVRLKNRAQAPREGRNPKKGGLGILGFGFCILGFWAFRLLGFRVQGEVVGIL